MRIKYSLLPKLRNLSNREMDFFLYIARYQNTSGHIVGVHNKDVCEHTGMCKQSFYTAMRSLDQKGLISVAKNSDIDYDITILDNDFSYDGAYKEGYINLHRQIFHKQAFKKLKANEKYLLFELLKRTHENSSSYHVGTRKFYSVFTGLLGVTERVIRYYLHNLRKFFSVGIKNGQYWITYMHSVFHEQEARGVEEQEFEFFIQSICRRDKVSGSEQEIHDTARLIKQYRPRYKEWYQSTVEQLKKDIATCIHQCAERGNKLLSAAQIHKMLQQTMEKAF